jgi:hypothetical protein
MSVGLPYRLPRPTSHALRRKCYTFGQAADRYFDAHEARWKNAKSRYQWRQDDRHVCKPVIGKMPIAAVDTEAVLQVLKPIWATKTETATSCAAALKKCSIGPRP